MILTDLVGPTGTVPASRFDRRAGEPTTAGELLELLTRRPAFFADALCLEYPELSWFPSRGEDLAPVKAVCSHCLVRVECLAYAVDTDASGVWGGTSERQRRVMRTGKAA